MPGIISPIYFVVQDLYPLSKTFSKPSLFGFQLSPHFFQPKNKAGDGWWVNAG